MRISLISAALVAALVGFGSTIALVLAAAQALGASPEQTASWIFAICLAKAVGSAALSGWSRVPVVLAWSTPGAALIAASHGLSMAEGVAAFGTAGLLILLTGMVKPLGRLVAMIPAPLAAAMLAGVLLPFCLKVPVVAAAAPALVLPLIAIFMLVRLWNPAFAVLAALGCGLMLAAVQAGGLPHLDFTMPALTLTLPKPSLAGLIGLGLPLYLVTMASQNLPGFAVMRSAGFEPPVARALEVTGALSAISALFGAHTINMAAITAAICMGDDVHPDRRQRWKVGIAYAAVWVGLGVFSPFILALIAILPASLITAVAGLALLQPLMGALGGAFAEPSGRFAAVVTVSVAAAGVSALGIGGAFWGLVAGLTAHGLERVARVR